ncbi:hypothetical protein ACIRYZ_41470 [Kitasatospora sp. NPDC101155]|uniref:hypothetical protein n=1 Tax=Kitasatospora sp. NPDC101155 TaxID=3364097 RepID=UPI003813C6B9
MADLKVFRRDVDGRDVELRGSTVARERELQRRVEASMEEMLGVRFLASEYPTGPWHQGRIDTLGLDEDNVPVVVEFKRGRDSGVSIALPRGLAARHAPDAGLRRSQLGHELVLWLDVGAQVDVLQQCGWLAQQV